MTPEMQKIIEYAKMLGLEGLIPGMEKIIESEGYLHIWTVGKYKCYISRHSRDGFWRGYIGVPKGHPLYGKHELNKMHSIAVHGGITCTRGFHEEEWDVDGVRNNGFWYFGFDAMHSWDLRPISLLSPRFMESSIYEHIYKQGQDKFGNPTIFEIFNGEVNAQYRTKAEMIKNCEDVVKQFQELENGGERI